MSGKLMVYSPKELSSLLGGIIERLDRIEKLLLTGKPEISPAPKTNTVDANRVNLVRIMEESDWNIARVSRELGVTRRTLYMRLAAFGIARKKVPRLAKPLKRRNHDE